MLVTLAVRSDLTALARLSWREQRVLLHAWLLLPLVALRLVVRGLRPEDLERPAEPAVSGEAVQRLRHLVEVAASHHLAPMRCLVRALTLKRMLAGRQVAAQLRIGVRRTEGGTVSAHAWLEVGGRPILERREIVARYLPLVDARKAGSLRS